MIPPREKVMVAIPSKNSQLDCGCFDGLLRTMDYWSQPLILGGCSDPGLARCKIAHVFVEKATEFDWLMMIDDDMIFTREDWELLWEGDELIVCGDYSKKILGQRHTGTGLGFTRVHRSVFEMMKDLKTDEGGELVERFYMDGEVLVDYFPSGTRLMKSRRLGEDQGFFMLCSLVTQSMRWEKRTRLGHVGRFVYGYPNQIPGYEIRNDEEAPQ